MLLTSYDKDSIVSLDPIDHIRKRPTMYLPDTDVTGLHHLIEEILNNSVDEYLEGHGNKIVVTVSNLVTPNIITVTDFARGCPFGYREDLHMDIMTAIFTKSFTGGKFESGGYNTGTSGMNGVGIKACNALSKELSVSSVRDGSECLQSYAKGKLQETSVTRTSNKNGTSITFRPDDSVFSTTSLDIDRLRKRLMSLSSILPGLSVVLNVPGDKQEKSNYLEKEPLKAIHEISSLGIHEELFSYSKVSKDVQVLISYHKTPDYSISSYCNTVHTYDNGSHVDSIIKCVVSVLKRLTGKVFSRSQVQSGLNLTLSVFGKNIHFRGQHKSQVADSEVFDKVYKEVYQDLYKMMEKDDKFVDYMVELSSKQEGVLRDMDIRQTIKKLKKSSSENRLPGKLAVAYNAKPEDREIFIVEGDSASGGLRMARNPKYQEVLPIRGKILNAYKAEANSILKSEEVANVFMALGGVEGSNTSLRSHNVFINTDADPDGCFPGDTKIPLLDGTFVPIKDLVNKDKFWVYSCRKDGKIMPGLAHSARITKHVTDLIEVTLDNGEAERCTPEHPWMMRDGSYKEAQELAEGDSMMPHLDERKIKSIKKIKLDSPIPVYDITVDKYHNFAIGTNGVFVHNSSSSDLMQDGVNRMYSDMQNLGLKSIILGTVHDSVLLDIYPGELLEIVKLLKFHFEDYPQKTYDWLVCPMNMDISIGDSWGSATEVKLKTFTSENLEFSGTCLNRDLKVLSVIGGECYNLDYSVDKKYSIDPDSFSIDTFIKDTEKVDFTMRMQNMKQK